MNIFDNCLISDLPIVLKEDSILNRYYKLIPVSTELCGLINNYGIKDTNSFFEKINSKYELEKIVEKTNIDIEYFLLLKNMLVFYRFRTIKLNKIDSFNKKYIKILESADIKDTGSLMNKCKIYRERKKFSELTGIDIEDINKMVYISDIMRLPGVKDIRANLYYDAGFHNLKKISEQNPLEMKDKISKYIKDNNIHKSPPFQKELTTQIAWAKIYPEII